MLMFANTISKIISKPKPNRKISKCDKPLLKSLILGGFFTSIFRKDDVTMKEEIEHICPNCQTGQNTYLLDSKNPFCSYIQHHNGKTCSMYVPLKNNEDNT